MHIIHKLIFEDCKYIQETPAGSQIRERRLSRLQVIKAWLENWNNMSKPKKWVKNRKWLYTHNKGLRVTIPLAGRADFVEENFEAFEYAHRLGDVIQPETSNLMVAAFEKKKLKIFSELGTE